MKSSDKYNFIDLKSIFSYESFEELKEKEEKLEKKLKKGEKINGMSVNNENESFEDKNNNKNKNPNKQKTLIKKAEGNKKIDSMFQYSNN